MSDGNHFAHISLSKRLHSLVGHNQLHCRVSVCCAKHISEPIDGTRLVIICLGLSVVGFVNPLECTFPAQSTDLSTAPIGSSMLSHKVKQFMICDVMDYVNIAYSCEVHKS